VRAGVEGLADALREGAKFIIQTTVGWWLNIPSIDLSSSAAGQIRDDLMYVSLVVATAGVMWGGARMAFRRSTDATWDVGTGLLRLAAAVSLGFLLPQLLLRAGDAFSTWALDSATSNQVTTRLVAIAGLGGVTAPGAVILAAIIMILAGLVQALEMFLREGGIIILSGTLILAAAGGFNPATKSWFPKVSGWLVALIMYKPFAALVYAAALHEIGSDSNDPRNVFIGLAMLLLSVIALPTMMRFFSWAAPGAIGAASGFGSGATALAGGALAAAALQSGAGARTAADQSAAVEKNLGPVAGGAGGSTSGLALTPAPAGAAMNGSMPSAAGGAAAAAGPAGAAVVVADAVKSAASAAKGQAEDAISGGGAG